MWSKKDGMPKDTLPFSGVSTPCLMASRHGLLAIEGGIFDCGDGLFLPQGASALSQHRIDDREHGILVWQHAQPGVVVVRPRPIPRLQGVVKGSADGEAAVSGNGGD